MGARNQASRRVRRSRRGLRRARLPLWLAAALALLIPGLTGGICGGGGSSSGPVVLVTLDAVPDALNDLLVVPPSGFTVDVDFPDPGAVVPETLTILIASVDDGSAIDVTGDLVVQEPARAVAVVSPANALPVGTHEAWAFVEDVNGTLRGASLRFAVRRHPTAGPPLADPQWVQLDFAADPDGDGQPDLPGDLDALGLLAADPELADAVIDWIVAEIVSRTQAFFDTPNPSGLPGGDAADIVFDSGPPGSGPFTRICVGGADPSGQGVIGNLMFDPVNSKKDEVACDTFLPSGVFPREILGYSGSSVFGAAFGPVLAVPVGEDPRDPTVLGPGFDPDDPEQLARFLDIEAAVSALAQTVATVTAHETGHAIGLVPRGEPGGGLFGGRGGSVDTHNVTPAGETPAASFLMNEGKSFSFAELSGYGGASLPTFRELNFAYLRGRLVLDSRVTGLYPAPVLDGCTPAQVSLRDSSVVSYTCTGEGFVATPSLTFEGPVMLALWSETLVSSEEMTAGFSALQLAPGTYDLSFENGDGQTVVGEGMLTVVE